MKNQCDKKPLATSGPVVRFSGDDLCQFGETVGQHEDEAVSCFRFRQWIQKIDSERLEGILLGEQTYRMLPTNEAEEI